MIGRIIAIALNTFREAVRNRVVHAVVVVALALMMAAIVIGEMSLHEEARVARDLGLFVLSLFGILTAIILGSMLLYTEIARRTIHTILAKPLERWEFVAGKYAGMALTLLFIVGVFTGCMIVLLWLQDVPFTAALAKAVVLAYLEILVIAAVAVFFSSFSSPVLSGLFTFGVFIVGRLTAEMRLILEQSKDVGIENALRATLWLVPDLHLFAISGGTVDGEYVSVHSQFVDWGYVSSAALYALLWIAILLGLGFAIFARRDFA